MIYFEQFYAGIHPSVATYIRTCSPKTLDEAISLAQTWTIARSHTTFVAEQSTLCQGKVSKTSKVCVKENSLGAAFTFNVKIRHLNFMSKKEKKLVVFGRKMTEQGIVTPPDAILSSYCCHNSEGTTHCRSCCKHIFYKYVHIGRHV